MGNPKSTGKPGKPAGQKSQPEPATGKTAPPAAPAPDVWVIQVQGDKPAPPAAAGAVLTSPASEAVLSPRRENPARRTLGELLETVPGLQVKSLGGPGAFATVSLRGSTSEQVAVYLDGLPLNQALGGGVNVGALSLAGVERVEVYKSHPPARFAEAPAGGVVNLVSRQQTKTTPGVKVKGQAGSHGWASASLEGAGAGKKGRWRFLLNQEGYKGDFDYADDFGTPFNPADDLVRTRANNSHVAREALYHQSFADGKKNLWDVSLWLKDRREGVPGFGVAQSRLARLKTSQGAFSLRRSRPLGKNPRALHELSLRHSHTLTRFSDPEGKTGGAGVQNNRNLTTLWRVASDWTGVGGRGRWQWHAALSQERYRPKDNAQPGVTVGRASTRHSLLLSGGHQRPLTRRLSWSFTPRFSFTRSRLGGDFSSPRFSKNDSQHRATADAALVFAPTPRTAWRLGAGEGFRLPSFYELYGDRGAVVGNTALVPEKTRRQELGWRWSAGRASVDAAWFFQQTRDQIVFEQTGQFVSRPVNVGQSRTQGQELSWGLALNRRVSLGGGVTHLKARNQSPDPAFHGNQVPGVAQQQWFHRLGVTPAKGWELSWEMTRRGRLAVDAANFTWLPAQRLHHLTARYTARRWAAWVGVKNVGDDPSQDVNGFPQPGRQWQAGWEGEF